MGKGLFDDVDWSKVGKGLVSLAFQTIQSEVETVQSEFASLKDLGKQLGIPYVPGEDLGEYRKRVIAARDARK